MSQDVVTYEVREDIAFLTLNRPDKLNALSDGLCDRLMELWRRVEDDPAVRVAILSAAGPHFCAGADLDPGAADLSGALPGIKQHQIYTGNGFDRFKPVVGVVHGYALGAGFALAVRGCDVVVAADDAMFGYPEARAGVALAPPEPSPYMPFKLSLEFMLLAWKGGRMISAERAHALGFVNAVVPRAQAMDEALAYARQLKLVPPLYIRSVKAGHYRATLPEVSRTERDYMEFVLPQARSADAKESLAAFRERRDPVFTGR
jgi:enoyl-CoA hydratase/carnithine racemase